MKNKKIIWRTLLIIGIIPFAIPLISGIDSFINGYCVFCLTDCKCEYGFTALKDSIFMYSWIFWPTYIIGIILIIISIVKLKNKITNIRK